MLNSILHATAVRLSCIAPVVLGNELLLGAVVCEFGLALHREPDRAPCASVSPTIFNGQLAPRNAAYLVSHGQGNIVFVVESPRHKCNRPAGDDFPNKHHSTADLFPVLAAD